jgi:hypothetical protein
MSPVNREEPAVVVAKAYDLVLWLLPKTETFSPSHRFSVGEREAAHGLSPAAGAGGSRLRRQ